MASVNLQAIVLAAGKSTRFNTSKTKLSFMLCGQEMVLYPLKLLLHLNIRPHLVLGYQKEYLLSLLDEHSLNLTFTEQQEQKGTGHALLCTQEQWSADHILVMNGDMPLLSEGVIQSLIDRHREKDATISLVIAHNSDPSVTGYGRIVKQHGRISIVEARDFTGDTTVDCCLNAGIYIFKRSFLEKTLPKLQHNSTNGELYITDLIKMASETDEPLELVSAPFDSIRGVNTLQDLWIAEQIKRADIIKFWMAQGVRFTAPQTTHIDYGVILEPDTTINTGVQLRGTTSVGRNCFIDAFSVITNTQLHDNVTVHPHSVISDSEIHRDTQVGPFAHIHHKSTLQDKSIIGNFVEVTRSSIGTQSKAKHLAYIGDAFIGSRVNVGAGAVVCNYNGVSKHPTIIEDGADIGSNSSLIAPLTVGKESFIGAGSVITKNVPSHALTLSRSEQIIKEQYAPKLKEKYKKATIKQSEQENA